MPTTVRPSALRHVRPLRRRGPAVVTVLMALCIVDARAWAGDGEVGLPDTFAGRVEALASMASLEAAVLAGRSATLVLEHWCADHALATPPRLRAVRDRAAAKPADAEVRRALAVEANEPVRYRHVALTCGDRVLSDADNWYVPGRLTAAMNAALDDTDEPFGKVIAPLGPTRELLASSDHWQPLAPGWERRLPAADGPVSAAALPIPPVLFQERAIVFNSKHQPLSVVIERYTRANLAFGQQP